MLNPNCWCKTSNRSETGWSRETGEEGRLSPACRAASASPRVRRGAALLRLRPGPVYMRALWRRSSISVLIYNGLQQLTRNPCHWIQTREEQARQGGPAASLLSRRFLTCPTARSTGHAERTCAASLLPPSWCLGISNQPTAFPGLIFLVMSMPSAGPLALLRG